MPVDTRRPLGGRAHPAGRRPEQARQGTGPVRRQPAHAGPAESHRHRRADQAEILVADQGEKAVVARPHGRQEKDARQAFRRRRRRQE